MELFKNTNFDFLRWKWPFITASLVVTAAGFISWGVKGGLNYGIDFRGGAQMRLRFNTEPPLDQIRKALDQKAPGASLQQLTGAQEVEVVTPIRDEKQLNASRQVIEDTLRGMFADPGGKLDVNNSSVETLTDALRPPLLEAGVALSDMQLQEVVQNIEDFRNQQRGGLLKSFDELSSVKGVTPQIIQALKKECVLGPFTILSADVVGPKIGADIKAKAIEATLYALAGMLVYIWFRFEWIYGLAAVVAVFHDTLITIGLFSLTNKEISLTVVAALLTLVGYSMNDTIVTFDRIRENLKILRREKLEHLINISVNQTLSRTVLTSGLTLLTALSLWMFGGAVLNGFSFALVWGIIFGTYSSVFIASPILLLGHAMIERRKGQQPSPETGGGTKPRLNVNPSLKRSEPGALGSAKSGPGSKKSPVAKDAAGKVLRG
jgi:preprotein translocase subunit SecF